MVARSDDGMWRLISPWRMGEATPPCDAVEECGDAGGIDVGWGSAAEVDGLEVGGVFP